MDNSTIQIRDPNGDLHDTVLTRQNTLGELRIEVFRIDSSIAIEEQVLIHNGLPLHHDDRQLSEFNITDEVHFRKRIANVHVEVFIASMRFEQHKYVDTDDTVAMLINQCGNGFGDHALFFNGQRLLDELPLSHYEVKDGCTVYLNPVQATNHTSVVIRLRGFQTTLEFDTSITTGRALKSYFARSESSSLLVLNTSNTLIDDKQTLEKSGVLAGAVVTIYDVTPNDLVFFVVVEGAQEFTSTSFCIPKSETINDVLTGLSQVFQGQPVHGLEYRDRTSSNVVRLTRAEGNKTLGNFAFSKHGVIFYLVTALVQPTVINNAPTPAPRGSTHVPVAPLPDEDKMYPISIADTPLVIFVKASFSTTVGGILQDIKDKTKHPFLASVFKDDSLQLFCAKKLVQEKSTLGYVLRNPTDYKELQLHAHAHHLPILAAGVIDVAAEVVGKKPKEISPSADMKAAYPKTAETGEIRNAELKAIYKRSRDAREKKQQNLDKIAPIKTLTFNADPEKNREMQLVAEIMVTALGKAGTHVIFIPGNSNESNIRALDSRPGPNAININLCLSSVLLKNKTFADLTSDLPLRSSLEFKVRQSIHVAAGVPIEDIVLMNITTDELHFDILIPSTTVASFLSASDPNQLLAIFQDKITQKFKTDFPPGVFIGIKVSQENVPDILVLSPGDFDERGNTEYDKKKRVMQRGGKDYIMPVAPWRRYGFSVLGIYENGIWLRQKSEPGEWAVAFHGTKTAADSMVGLSSGEKSASSRGISSGIYLTADIENISFDNVVVNGKKYKVAFQCRYRPEALEILERRESKKEKKSKSKSVSETGWFIVPSSQDVRPYGILIKEMSDDN